MSQTLTLTAVCTPDEDGWTMARLAEWPAVVTCGRTVEDPPAILIDAAQEAAAGGHGRVGGPRPPRRGWSTARTAADWGAGQTLTVATHRGGPVDRL